MLTHSQPPACRFMYSPGMGNGNYSGNPMQSYNYFPIDFNMPPSLLFRSGQHEIVSAADSANSAAVAAAAHFAGSTPLDYSGNIQNSASQSVHTSMESINGGCAGNDDISSVISAQSSPEYMSEYGSTLQLQNQRNNQQQYYQQTSMQVDESGAPSTPTPWNTSNMMQQQQMSVCEPTTAQVEMELMKKDQCTLNAKLNKKLHQKMIKCESKQQLQSTDHSIGMNIVFFSFIYIYFES